jgi:hypothetical protein
MSRRFGREGCDQSITAADAASAVSSPARFPQPLVGADAVAAATEWDEFRKGNLAHLRDLMRQPIVFDGGNIYDPEMMEQLGFTYFSVRAARQDPPVEECGVFKEVTSSWVDLDKRGVVV